MIDVLAIPLYYISFNKNTEVEYHYQDFGFKNINHFSAIDGRKLQPTKLLEEGKITIRCYSDLVGGRHQHSGMSSMGGVGCTMSHCALWQLCIDQNLPYMIIVEEDNRISNLQANDLENISKAIQKRNGIFISTTLGRSTDGSNPFWGDNDSFRIHFTGLNFYVVSIDSCKELVKYCFPIDVQTDWYMSNLASRGKLTLSGYRLSYQTSHPSSIQDFCIKCILPQKVHYYRYIVWIIIIIVVLAVFGGISSVFFRSKWKVCEQSCSSSQLTDI